MSTPFKHALIDHPEPAYRVAQKIDKSDVWLSKVASGLIEPQAEDKERLAQVLAKPAAELFPDKEADSEQT